MGERLAWQEIVEKYPDQWVALDNVEFRNRSNVKSAVVICSMSDDVYISTREQYIRDGRQYVYKRTSDSGAFMGVKLCL